MPTIKVQVRGKVAENLTREVKIVCRNSDYEVEFDFDEAWDAHELRTGLFVYNGVPVPVPFTGNICKVPPLFNTNLCAIGVMAGGLVTTKPAYADCEKSVADLAVEGVEPPTEDVYTQLVQMIEDGMLKGDKGQSVVYLPISWGKPVDGEYAETLTTMLPENLEVYPNVGDLAITKDGILAVVTNYQEFPAFNLYSFKFLSVVKGEKGEKGDKGGGVCKQLTPRVWSFTSISQDS